MDSFFGQGGLDSDDDDMDEGGGGIAAENRRKTVQQLLDDFRAREQPVGATAQQVDAIFEHYRTKWIANRPNLRRTSLFAWVASKVGLATDSEDEFSPSAIERVFDFEFVILLELYKFCQMTKDASGEILTSKNTAAGLERSKLLSRFFNIIQHGRRLMMVASRPAAPPPTPPHPPTHPKPHPQRWRNRP